MMGGKKKYAIIVAGGAGTRMGSKLPKQFLLLRGKPVLWHTVSAFLEAYEDLVVILVLPSAYMETGRELGEGLGASSRIRLVEGGATRWHSVQNGLRLAEEDAVIAVHDGVRCLVTSELIRRCFEQASRLGSAVPVTGCADSVRLVEEEGSKPIDRSRIKLVQTPQTFEGSILFRAYQAAKDVNYTDDATVVEASRVGVHLIDGEPFNIKITTPFDLEVAEQVLEYRSGGRANGGDG
jgi:2-C-methyl-D-erythritol 4-phosphate cytidylyltransferase